MANSAKHFEVEAKHHRSVSETRKIGSYWPEYYWRDKYFPQKYWPEVNLVIRLQGDGERELGSVITVLELSQRILDYWESLL